MRRELELTLHFGPGQSARLELAGTFGIAHLDRLARLFLLFFPLFQPFGETGFGVDESFSCVTHHTDYTHEFRD